jgi:DNA repair ATPase RecN
MDDDALHEILREIAASQSKIEAHVSSLKTDMEKICNFKESTITSLQRVNDYMSSREDLPDEITMLKMAHQQLKDKTESDEKLNADSRKKTDFLMVWAWKISGAIIVLGIINTILIALGRYVDIEYILR